MESEERDQQTLTEEDGSRITRDRSCTEEETLSREGKKPKGAAMEDATMDEAMLEEGGGVPAPRMWNLVSPFKTIDLDNGYLILRFHDDGDYRHVLEEGPWIVNDHYVVVQRWRPFFDPYDESVKKMAVWVRIPGLPIELYTARYLWRIGNIFGRTLKVDRNSLRKSEVGEEVITERGKFARICVEIDLRKSLLSKFVIGNKVYPVGYECLHLLCFKCGMYGHKKDNCPEAQTQCSQHVVTNVVDQEEAFGSWMIIQRNPRSRKLKANPVIQNNVVGDQSAIKVSASPVLDAVTVLPVEEAGKQRLEVQSSTIHPINEMGSIEDSMEMDNNRVSLPKEIVASRSSSQKKSKKVENGARRIASKEGKDKPKLGPKSTLKKSGTENVSPNSVLEGVHKGLIKNRGKSLPIQEAGGTNLFGGRKDFSENPLLTKGVGKKCFPALVRDLSFRFKVSVMALLETRVGGVRGEAIITRLGFSNFFKQDPIGFSGGLWILWDGNKVELDVLHTHYQFVHTRVKYLDSKKVDLVTFVYGNPRRLERRLLWAELESVSTLITDPWLILGDFNSVLKAYEKVGGKDVCWDNMFEMHQSLLRPLLICNNGQSRPGEFSRSFKFLAAWLTDHRFYDLVKKSWEKDDNWITARGRFETDAIKWHQNVFKEHMKQKNRLYSRLNGLDSYKYGRFDHSTEVLQSLWKELQSILVKEELTWYQRSRCQWLKFGDRNSKLLHSFTLSRRRHNMIVTLKDNQGNWIADTDSLINLAVSFYQDLFKADEERHGEFPIQNAFPSLTIVEKRFLFQKPSKEEIKKAVFRMGKFKAPGPDGLNDLFFQSQWDTIGTSVCKMVEETFYCPGKVREINGTLICLIPKKDSPENIKDFRPISLCNVVYKIITKTIAERLRNLLPRIVSPNQSSFIKGRQGTNNIIIAQEFIHSMRSRKGRKGWMMVKVDLEKAYDRLDWDFVRETMKDVGFPESLTDLVYNCISTSSMNLLRNGVRTKAVVPGRGIRQGDPISPYLFVLCMERLGHLINVAVETKAWKPILLRKNAPPISHLFFADDIILCAEASLDQAHVMNQVMKLFTGASGQKVSKDKTRVFFSKNVCLERAKEISASLGIGITSDLGKYLGVPLHHKRVTKGTFKHVLGRVLERLSGWNLTSLSLAGHSVLAKSVLEALPAYSMQSASLPVGVCNEVEKLTRSFIWGSSQAKRKTHLVSGKRICKAKKDGGLGFRDQKQVNKAFSMKLGFEVLTNKEDLWIKVLRSKYKVEEVFSLVLQKNNVISNTWKCIQKAWDLMLEGTRTIIGDGTNTYFWTDRWVPNVGKLLDHVVTIIPEEAKCWRVWDCVREGSWDWIKLSPLLPNEILDAIGSLNPPSEFEGQDRVIWTSSSSGLFTIKSAYDYLSRSDYVAGSSRWDLVWHWEGPQRIKFFLWLLFGNKLLTNAVRVRRNMTNIAVCPRCHSSVEEDNHAFRQCSWVREVWKCWVDVRELEAFLSDDMEDWITKNLDRDRRNSSWRLKFGVICWFIWKDQNSLVFNEKGSSLQEIFSQVSIFVNNTIAANEMSSMAGLAMDRFEEIWVNWRPPPADRVKINFDGAFSGSGSRASCGGVCRDGDGHWIMGYSQKLNPESVLMAELWGLTIGLEWAWNQHFKRIIVEGDSLIGIQLVREGCTTSHPCFVLVSRIRMLLLKDWFVEIEHVYREANQVANWLAVSGNTGGWDTQWYERVPSGCEELFDEDVKVPVATHSMFSTVTVFNGLNFSEWKEQIQFYLGVMDMDMALREEEPGAITDESTEDERDHFKNWERSNRLSL
ncbi:uncharacterized protein LOC133305695, partial [Gastrolobium bilobum]|uniref:uncharacterized protein LOC133305695 n=1 Tax=Gastrolobium bilobum TaxID=150636 RepID=UPI002AB29314